MPIHIVIVPANSISLRNEELCGMCKDSNGRLLLPKRLNTTLCRLVACSTQTRKPMEPPGTKLVEDRNRLMLTNGRQNVMALKQTQACVF